MPELEDIAEGTSKIPRGTAAAANTHPHTAGAGCRYSTALPAGTPRWAPPRAAAGNPGCNGTQLSFPLCTPCQTQHRSWGLGELHRTELGRGRGKNTAKKSVSFQFYHGFAVSELKAQIPSFPVYKSSSPLLNPRSCNECPLSQRIRFSTPVYQRGNSKANAEYQFLLEETLARTFCNMCNTKCINTVFKSFHTEIKD